MLWQRLHIPLTIILKCNNGLAAQPLLTPNVTYKTLMASVMFAYNTPKGDQMRSTHRFHANTIRSAPA